MIESVPEAALPVILIADDDEDIRSLVAFRLEHSGFGVLQARNGVEAVLLAREHHPALLVLDAITPNLDGYGVMRELRMDEETSRIPVILLTARVQERDVMHGFEEGASDYLKKPFSPDELLARVRTLLASR